MAVVQMKQLLESGVHFGHQTRRWNPKMAKYIYTSRNTIHIIDLQKTAECIEIAYNKISSIAKEGGRVLFIGTKKQAQLVVKEEAIRCGQFYVDQRWLGGTLTNFKTINNSIKRLKKLSKMEEDGTFDKLPKKEVILLRKEMARGEKFLGGIKTMKELPKAIFVIDPKKEINAINEARKLHIPVFGIVDTNCDPDDVDYIIPANDDALRAIKLIVFTLANAVIEANGGEIKDFVVERSPNAGRDYKGGNRNNRNNRPYTPRDNNRPYTPRDNNKPYTPRNNKDASGKPYTKPAVKPTAGKPVSKPTTVTASKVVAAKVESKPVSKPTTAPKAVSKPEVSAKPVTAPKVAAAKVTAPKVTAPKVVAAKVESKPVSKPKPVAAPKVVAAKVESTDLSKKTVAELKSMAKDKGITGYTKMKKAELVDLLK